MALVSGAQDGAESTDEKRRHRVCEEKHPIIAMCVHPGTVDTKLSEPFKKNVPAEKLFTPEYAADATARSHRRRQLGAVERKLVRLRGRKDSVVARARVWVSDYF